MPYVKNTEPHLLETYAPEVRFCTFYGAHVNPKIELHL